MADPAWLTIIGMGEHGVDDLPASHRAALAQAEVVIGPARHIALIGALNCAVVEWPVPFADGVDLLLGHRGRRVVMLASGDPFWFGAGSAVTAHLARHEWVALPAPSTFTRAAAQLGWAVQDVACLGLHAAPLERLRMHLAPGQRAIVLLRDGAAVADLAAYLVRLGFGPSTLHVLEALGGPQARARTATAQALDFADIAHPVAVGVEFSGSGQVVPLCSGLPDDLFGHDGQITKRAVRALALSALAPRTGELLWDIGSGSGSIAIEWLLAHRAMRAAGVEADPARAARARANAMALGVDRLRVIEGRTPACLPDGPAPDAVFIGGGLSQALLDALWRQLPTGTRIIAHAVTLESEALLARAHGERGGALLRIELADAAPLGSRQGWKPRYPVVQWSVTL